jgi:hypothetical protein
MRFCEIFISYICLYSDKFREILYREIYDNVVEYFHEIMKKQHLLPASGKLLFVSSISDLNQDGSDQ